MSSEFVRYAAEIETIDPHFDETLAQIIDFVQKKGRESPRTEGAGRAIRAAHAKSFGLVKTEVEILADVPAAYAQGIYAKPGRHGALIRFSPHPVISARTRNSDPASASRSKYSMLTESSW
jgi:hypothetical protein